MSLADFRNGQSHVEAHHAASPAFESLVPLVLRMYGCVRDLAQSNGSPTMGRLFMLCHREFLVAANLIQRRLPYDAAEHAQSGPSMISPWSLRRTRSRPILIWEVTVAASFIVRELRCCSC